MNGCFFTVECACVFYFDSGSISVEYYSELENFGISLCVNRMKKTEPKIQSSNSTSKSIWNALLWYDRISIKVKKFDCNNNWPSQPLQTFLKIEHTLEISCQSEYLCRLIFIAQIFTNHGWVGGFVTSGCLFYSFDFILFSIWFVSSNIIM